MTWSLHFPVGWQGAVGQPPSAGRAARLSLWMPCLLGVLLAAPLARADDGGVDGGAPEDLAPQAVIGATGADAGCGPPCAALTTQVRVDLALSGAASSDPEGEALTYLWEVVSRPPGSTSDFTEATGVDTRFTPDLPGLYSLGLATFDPAGNTGRATLRLEVESIPFVLDFRLLADGRQLNCSPRCPDGVILIGSEVVADATASSNDSAHGALVFDWSLAAPGGSRAALRTDNATPGRVSVLPDVDGAYELRLKLSDAKDQAEAFASWRILHPLQWKPLDCAMDGAPRTTPGLMWLIAGLGLRVAWRRRARR